ncbi:hypothetical protein ABIA30_000993 [Mycobacterium sp. MAA66]|uniref:hypothetical protein n=1 Tax=Mycobacterium sp. MAA66 TaxID=3156297 RepID=UPI0035172A34
MGILASFAPWFVYWILVGDVPFEISGVLALAVAIAAYGIHRTGVLEIGAVATFLALTGISLTATTPVSQHWLLALSFAGICVVTLVGLLTGRPFVREYVALGLPADVLKTELFGRIVALLSWMWVMVFAAMTVSAAIPSVIDPDSTLFDVKSPLAYVCYWVVPAVLFAAAALLSKALPDRLMIGIDDLARSTTFVAFAEVEIDQLLYLAQEHANKEVGPGKEAYNVRIGSKGTPLVGDDTRQSWPSTYKVRDKRR